MNFVSIIEKLLLWIEKDVSIEKHQLNIKRLTSEINKYLIVNKQGKERREFNCLELDVYNSIDLLIKGDGYGNYNADRVLLINDIDLIIDDSSLFSIHMQFQELNDNSTGDSDNNPDLSLKIENLLKTASWTGNQREKNNAHIASRLIFWGLRLKFLDKGYAALKTKFLIDKLPSNRLFNSNGMVFGSSFLLRSSLILVREGLGDEFLEYTKDLSELILRRLEIKKESIIPMDDKIQNEKSLLLEHLRCLTAILEAYTVLSDVRFLNAALKANDRVYPYIIKIKINMKMSRRNLINILISCNYMKLIKKQENFFLLLCQT
jgi:hypothetical protein